MKAINFILFTAGAAMSLYTLCATAAGTDSTGFAVKLDITATCSISAVSASDVDVGRPASNAGSLAAGRFTVNGHQ